MSFYLQIEGIKGNVSAKKYEHAILVHQLSITTSTSHKQPVGKVADRSHTTPRISHFSVGKLFDNASPHLFMASLQNTVFPKITLRATTQDDNSHYLEYTLHDAMLSNYQLIGISDDNSSEEINEDISISFSKIEQQIIPRDKNNKAMVPISVGFDLETAQAL